MSTMERNPRMARYSRRAVRRSMALENALDDLARTGRAFLDRPLEGFAVVLYGALLGLFLAALLVAALLG